MSVYVDDARNPYRRYIMCHMMADTYEELDEMREKLGLNLKWIQYAGGWKEHYDISLSKRTEALSHGAISITQRAFVEKLRRRREQCTLNT